MKQTFDFLLCFFLWFMMGCSTNLPVSWESKGDSAFAEQHYNAALQYWFQSVDEKQAPEIFHKIGLAYLKLSNLNQAKEFFEKALQINPKAKAIRKDLIRTLLLKGDKTGALNNLGEAERMHGQDLDFCILSGDTFMMSNDLKRAGLMYEKAVIMDPKNPRCIIKLAICLIRTGEKQKAGKLISNLPKDKTFSFQNFMLLADYYFLTRDYLRAESYMIQAVEKDQGNITLRINLCRFYLETGMRDKARQVLMELENRHPDDTRFTLMLADLYLSEMNMGNAEKYLERVENKKEYKADYDLLKGKFWLFKGKTAYAVSSLKSAIEKKMGLVSGHYLLGIAYFAGGQSKLAENSFIRALMLDPDHVETLLALAGLHYSNREYDLAIQYLDRVLLLDPLNPRGYSIRGLCFMEQKKNDQASSAFSKAWILGNDLSSLFFLARSFEKRKEYDKALNLYNRMIDEQPEIADVLFRYSALLMDMGKGSQAQEKLDQIIVKSGKTQVITYISAWLSLNLGKPERAVQYLHDYGMGNPNPPGRYYTFLSEAYEKSGQRKQAELSLKTCIEKRPFFREAWSRLADFYFRNNKRDSALEVLKEACEKFPNDPELSGNLAWLYLEEGIEFDKALDLARKAYEKLSGEAWVMDTLGWAYFHKRTYSQAKWILSDAEQKAPDKGIIKYHLGMVFYRQGKLLKAKIKLKKALDYDVSRQERERIHDVLADLEPDKAQNKFIEETIFDPEKENPFPMDSDEDDDILKPDWSNLK